jgi:hypothetical protein
MSKESAEALTPSRSRDKKEESSFSKEALAILENEGNRIYFPKKYFASQRDFILREVKEIHSATPTLPIRQVVVNILSEMPDFLPPDNILNVTRQIVEQWQKLTEEATPIP